MSWREGLDLKLIKDDNKLLWELLDVNYDINILDCFTSVVYNEANSALLLFEDCPMFDEEYLLVLTIRTDHLGKEQIRKSRYFESENTTSIPTFEFNIPEEICQKLLEKYGK